MIINNEIAHTVVNSCYPLYELKEFMYGVNDDSNEEELLQRSDFIRALNTSYCFNVVIDAGAFNHDLAVNEVYPHYNGRKQYLKDISDDSSILWLAKKQGYTKKELIKYFTNTPREKIDKDTFLGSLYVELENCTTHMNAIAFLIRCTLEDAINFKSKAYVNLPKNVTCGLIDSWCGAGGVLGIKLEKDICIGIHDIFKIMVDEAEYHSVHDVYCCTDELWTDIHEYLNIDEKGED